MANISLMGLIWTVLVFLGFILSVCLHEFGHAVVAYYGGDRSVKSKGYLTLNPLKYTDPAYSIVMPLVFLLLGGLPLPGAAVYINTSSLKTRGWQSAVSAAGPFATLIVAVAIALILQILNPDYYLMLIQLSQGRDLSSLGFGGWIIGGLVLLLVLEVAGVFLNLIPVPGLDGFGILKPWLPPSMQRQIQKYSRYGVLILFAVFWLVKPVSRSFWRLVYSVVLYLGVPPEISFAGFEVFRNSAKLLFFLLIVGLVIAKQRKKL